MQLNETEKAVMATIIMRLSEDEALAYMKGKNQEISRAQYYKLKGKIQASTMDRLNQVAKEFPTLHAQQIDELELIRTEMWKQYHLEKSPRARVGILKEIKDIQPFISAYNESTKDIVEDWVDSITRKGASALPSEIQKNTRTREEAQRNK